jgi:hypothetical protein
VRRLSAFGRFLHPFGAGFARARYRTFGIVARVAVASLLLLSSAFAAKPRIPRSSTAKTAFKHQHPCPATGRVSGPCKGWVIDHIMPLACGGPDVPQNMQWQTYADSKRKDAVERKDCKIVRLIRGAVTRIPMEHNPQSKPREALRRFIQLIQKPQLLMLIRKTIGRYRASQRRSLPLFTSTNCSGVRSETSQKVYQR